MASFGFNSIPADWNMPLYHVEVDPSRAGTRVFKQPAVMVGVKTAAGTATANEAIPVASSAAAKAAGGNGSQVARMVEAFLKNTQGHELWMLPVAEPAGGAAATGTITVSSAPTAAGTLALYIAGQLVSVGVAANDTTSTLAAKINVAIGGKTDLPVTSSVAANVVTLTSKWKGEDGNGITVAHSIKGSLGGQFLAAGLALTISGSGKLTGGSGAPDYSGAIASIGDEDYEYVALPHTDSVSLGLWEVEYGFSDNGRWGWLRQSFGHVFSARAGSYADLMVFGATRNAGVASIMAVEEKAFSPVWEWAAAYTAKAARALTNDPARPLQTLQFEGLEPALKSDRFSKTELSALAGPNCGLAVQQTLGYAGKPTIMRESTTYKTNALGQPDNALSLVTTLATLAALFRRQQQRITSKFGRHKLANDGTRFAPGQPIVTPKIIKAELVAEYTEAEFAGLVENVREFKNNLLVERDPENENRINVLYPPDLVNQLRVFAVLAQFRLQYSTIPGVAA